MTSTSFGGSVEFTALVTVFRDIPNERNPLVPDRSARDPSRSGRGLLRCGPSFLSTDFLR